VEASKQINDLKVKEGLLGKQKETVGMGDREEGKKKGRR
jgi:hypothetical protein